MANTSEKADASLRTLKQFRSRLNAPQLTAQNLRRCITVLQSSRTLPEWEHALRAYEDRIHTITANLLEVFNILVYHKAEEDLGRLSVCAELERLYDVSCIDLQLAVNSLDTCLHIVDGQLPWDPYAESDASARSHYFSGLNSTWGMLSKAMDLKDYRCVLHGLNRVDERCSIMREIIDRYEKEKHMEQEQDGLNTSNPTDTSFWKNTSQSTDYQPPTNPTTTGTNMQSVDPLYCSLAQRRYA